MRRRHTQSMPERKPPFSVGLDIGTSMPHASVVDAEGMPCVPKMLALQTPVPGIPYSLNEASWLHTVPLNNR